MSLLELDTHEGTIICAIQGASKDAYKEMRNEECSFSRTNICGSEGALYFYRHKHSFAGSELRSFQWSRPRRNPSIPGHKSTKTVQPPKFPNNTIQSSRLANTPRRHLLPPLPTRPRAGPNNISSIPAKHLPQPTPSTTDPPCQLNILLHDRDPLSMYGA